MGEDDRSPIAFWERGFRDAGFGFDTAAFSLAQESHGSIAIHISSGAGRHLR
jgi:hypothetical protein